MEYFFECEVFQRYQGVPARNQKHTIEAVVDDTAQKKHRWKGLKMRGQCEGKWKRRVRDAIPQQ